MEEWLDAPAQDFKGCLAAYQTPLSVVCFFHLRFCEELKV